MAQPPAAAPEADPSMEEILASIRRILNEEPPPARDEPVEGADVLVLDRSMMVAESVPAVEAPALDAGGLDAVGGDAVGVDAPGLDVGEPAVDAPVDEASEAVMADVSATPALAAGTLVAPEAAAAAQQAMGDLVRTLAADRRPPVWSQGPTLEDLVRATLRPLLKEWLDTHLPPLVERLVRAEIERVVGRAIP